MAGHINGHNANDEKAHRAVIPGDEAAVDWTANPHFDTTAIAIDTRAETAAEIARLARLPPVEYDRERTEAAKRLGVRATTLDDEVKVRRGGGAEAKGQGRTFEVPKIEPWSERVDGATLLLDVTDAIRRYVAMPDGAAEIVALWALHTHCFDCFMHSPRLALNDPRL